MKRKKLIAISFVSLLLIVSAILMWTKPTESQYASWMEETYKVRCLDYNCDTFKLIYSEVNERKELTMTSVYGSYSPGIFMIRKNNSYRNLEDPSYILDLKVKGIFGKILIENERKQLSFN
ncbi:hypothetical protein [Bacillus sp. FJAT-27245]|uniref:hypothetical protein n=1 Tax=Bacillus sp. FJAT-27245 TaxID=1684144 RepID=UPI0006A785F9|nr:hypothetical protein [Bacillus sp. FJAT-27245]